MIPRAESDEPTPVYLEMGKQRIFACALEWPGWCRSGKSEELALDALETHVARYEAVAREAGISFPADGRRRFQIVERISGSSAADFGAPAAVPACDREPLTSGEAERLAALVTACWALFERIVALSPAELRKGPRGGGRDRDKMVDHVLGAETAYARKLGVKHRQPELDNSAAIAALRGEIVAALLAPATGAALATVGWPPRYAARRIAWHVLDHAWEMEDRSAPTGI